MNAGGLVSRTVLTLPDECGVGYKYKASTLLDPVQVWQDASGFFSSGDIGTDDCPNETAHPPICSLVWQLADQLVDVKDGHLDTEPDLFSFNVGGYTGKFIMDKDGIFHIVPKSDVKIEYTINSTEGWITQFVITTPDGIRYIFGRNSEETGRTGLEFSYSPSNSSPYTVAPITWYLRKVETPDKKYLVLFRNVC